MAVSKRAEAYIAYAAHTDEIIRRLVDRGILAKDELDEELNRLYSSIKEEAAFAFSKTQRGKELLQVYLKRGVPQSQYISLTDMAREENETSPSYVIQGWLRSRNTLALLRIWETRNNPEFDDAACEELLQAAKKPAFTVTATRWIEKTNAIGLVTKRGKSGGTSAHPDIAGDFYMWLHPVFRLELIERLWLIQGENR